VFLKIFLFIVRRGYKLVTLPLGTAELFRKFSLLFLGKSRNSSHYFYVQLSFSENILSYSEQNVHSAHNTTLYSWVFLKMSMLFWGDCTYCSHYYHYHLRYSEKDLFYSEDTEITIRITSMYSWIIPKMFLTILRGQYILLALLGWIAVFLKMFLLILIRLYIQLGLLLRRAEFF